IGIIIKLTKNKIRSSFMLLYRRRKQFLLVLSMLLLVLIPFTSCQRIPAVEHTPQLPTATLPVVPSRVVTLSSSAPLPNTPTPSLEAISQTTNQAVVSTQSQAPFEYSGVKILPGDLVFLVTDEQNQNSSLYRAAASNNFAPELVFKIKGLAYQFYVHSDREGIDLATGEKDEGGAVIYQKLMSLRFSDNQAKEILIFDKQIYALDWSYDGRYLAVVQGMMGANQNILKTIAFVDLNCRIQGKCISETAEATGKLDLNPYDFRWSPKEYRVLFTGDPSNQYGTRDIYELGVGEDGKPLQPVNMTASDVPYDLNPVWLSDGKSFLFACQTSDSPNEYNLCKNNLLPGQETNLLKLPYNMKNFSVSPDGNMLFDFYFGEKAPAIRSFDQNQNKTSILMENIIEPKAFLFILPSPDGKVIGFIEEGGMQIVLFDLRNKQDTIIPCPSSGAMSWMLWIN
ncbi:MAG TPA: hypothetical protein VHP38_08090, partial [Ruminiclostridium sp.]|nr:hypothetical protein [Ruminiclostridium sp.]